MVQAARSTGRAFFIGQTVTKPARVAADAFVRPPPKSPVNQTEAEGNGTGMSTGKSGKHSKNNWELFTSFKQRGEWVELQFMAQAAMRRLAVSKPWGDMQAYDVGIEHGSNFLRVQVKSTTARSGAGYRCMFLPNHLKKRDYSLDQIDLFAAYVIPVDAWYLIPAVLLLGTRRLTMAMLKPSLPSGKEGQLPLRMLPRSLETAHQEPQPVVAVRTLRSNPWSAGHLHTVNERNGDFSTTCRL